MENKLSLGTAQFGLDYGIANTRGRIPEEEVFGILSRAHEKGIRVLDTAFSYGDSELVIGRFMEKAGVRFKVVSKTPHFSKCPGADVRECCHGTLRNLGQERIYGYMVHDVNDLYEKEDIWGEIQKLKDEGKVEKTGVSVYKPVELDRLLEKRMIPDILQLPYSILDQRFDGKLEQLAGLGTEVHARSVFLQGLFFLPPGEIKPFFDPVRKNLSAVWDISRERNIPLNALCLSFALMNRYIHKVVVGVDSLDQLESNFRAMDNMAESEKTYGFLRSLGTDNEEMVIPYRWK